MKPTISHHRRMNAQGEQVYCIGLEVTRDQWVIICAMLLAGIKSGKLVEAHSCEDDQELGTALLESIETALEKQSVKYTAQG